MANQFVSFWQGIRAAEILHLQPCFRGIFKKLQLKKAFPIKFNLLAHYVLFSFTFLFIVHLVHHFYSRLLLDAKSAEWPTPPRHLGNKT
jgi:hypothetical protein